MSTQRSLNQHLLFLNLYQHVKNQFIPTAHLPDWPYPFLIISNQKSFEQLFIFVNLYQHAKNEAVSSICSGEIVYLFILLADSV